MVHPCMKCDACCASFRVSFYWAETDAHPDGTVPQALTVAVSPHFVAMRGTDQRPTRCVALHGDIGHRVACTIYEQRSSTCREFSLGDSRCEAARLRHGLPPLSARERAWSEASA
jgi:Fe-S-cluster containining protein